MDHRPICPGCQELASPKDCGNGVVRWGCSTRDCPVADFSDSWNPNPTPPRQPGLFDARRAPARSVR